MSATATTTTSSVPPDPKIIDLIQKESPDGKPYVSIEFFPPRSEEAVQVRTNEHNSTLKVIYAHSHSIS